MKKIIPCMLILAVFAGCRARVQPTVVQKVTFDPPKLFSKTHPGGQWSSNPVATIQWKSPDREIKGFAIIMNTIPKFEVQPLVNLDSDAIKYTTPKLSDGIVFFHLRVIDSNDNMSTSAHYRLQVCAEKPITPHIQSPTHPEAKPVRNNAPKFIWEEPVAYIKGYYYSFSNDENTEPVQFLEKNGIEFKNLTRGTYYLNIRAVSRTNKKSDLAKYIIMVE